MKADKPFWETGVNPITGRKEESYSFIRSDYKKDYKIRVKQRLERYERFN